MKVSKCNYCDNMNRGLSANLINGVSELMDVSLQGEGPRPGGHILYLGENKLGPRGT